MAHVEGIFQIGIRAQGSARPEEVEAARAYGANIVTAWELHDVGMDAIVDRDQAGGVVDITVDAYPSGHFNGRVDSIQAGSGARFSLLPPENASGNFVKVVQRVPVTIVFDAFPSRDSLLSPGMSVVPVVKVK